MGTGTQSGELPTHAALEAALSEARQADNGGFDLDMWATVVDRDGIVGAVAFTGSDRGAQWPGSRVISAQKANTANAFSLPGLSLATANLFSAVQPGASLFGLQFSNPVNTEVAYGGEAVRFGQADDPMVSQRIGGVNVFGGGPRPLQRRRQVGGSHRRQRRQLLRRPQHRLEDPAPARAGSCPRRLCERRCATAGQHCLRHRSRRQRGRLRPSALRRQRAE